MSNPPISRPPVSHPKRSIPAAVTLFFLAPLVAEFLLGDFPATWLPLLIILAPMYGGGALLIRELTRRSHRGWPTILLLGVAYAIVEEAFTTQSLFNPDIFGLHMHLLSHAWIPALGIGAWWTLFMLNVHAFWSIGVSIALTEGLFPSLVRPDQPSAPTPWLGKVGLSVAALLFAVGVAFNTYYTFHHDPFRATHAQLLVSALLVVVFAVAAFLIPPASRDQSAALAPVSRDQSDSPNVPAPSRNPDHDLGPTPSPWLTGAAAFLLGAAVFLAPLQWNWVAVAWVLIADLIFLFSLWHFSRHSAWTPLHTLSVGAAGALVYGVHAFLQPPVVPCPKWVVLPSHILFLVLALAAIALAVRSTRSARRREQEPSGS